MRTDKSDVERFEEKTSVSGTGCIEWTAAKNGNGYGRFKPVCGQPGMALAHRWAYEHYVGPIAPGLVIDHLCRNTSCVNPAHLEPVTQLENTRRGLGTGSRTKCPKGHPYSGRNLYVSPDGARRCRECNRARSAINRLTKKEA